VWPSDDLVDGDLGTVGGGDAVVVDGTTDDGPAHFDEASPGREADPIVHP
jgi:hypothetical protein